MSLIKAKTNIPAKYIGIFQYHESVVQPPVAIIPIPKDRTINDIKDGLLLMYAGRL